MAEKLFKLFGRCAAAVLALAMLAGVFGCYVYVPESQQQEQSGFEDLFTVPPEAASHPTAQPTAELTTLPAAQTTAAPTQKPTERSTAAPTECPVSEDGQYDSKDDVALYIHLFGHLPSNYIKKSDAQALGWQGGSLEPFAPGCSIGGDRFGNYEGLLPRASGRYYTECDIGTKGRSSRGSKRIVFSNDGLIFYTSDHYDSFTQLYGGD